MVHVVRVPYYPLRLTRGPIFSVPLLVGYHGELKVNLFHNTRII